MSEIISLQLGPRAHHVMAHFWNLQNAYLKDDHPSTSHPDQDKVSFVDPRALFLERASGKFTPRALLLDLSSNFAPLRKVFMKPEPVQKAAASFEALCDHQPLTIVDSSDPDLSLHPFQEQLNSQFEQSPAQPHPFDQYFAQPAAPEDEKQQSKEGPLPALIEGFAFDSTVKHWVDYSQFSLDLDRHIFDIELGASGDQSAKKPFSAYWEGLGYLAENPDSRDDLQDKIRALLEQSDYLQAVQLLCDVDTGFLGLANYILTDYLSQQIPKTTVLLLGVSDQPHFSDDDVKFGAAGVMNQARLLHSLISDHVIYFPLDLGSLQSSLLPGLAEQNLYQQSALAAMAVNHLTLRARVRVPGARAGIDHFLTRYADGFTRTRQWTIASSLLFPELKLYDPQKNELSPLSAESVVESALQLEKEQAYSFTRSINQNAELQQKIDPSSVAFYSLLQSEAEQSSACLEKYLAAKFKRAGNVSIFQGMKQATMMQSVAIPYNQSLPISYPRSLFNRKNISQTGQIKLVEADIEPPDFGKYKLYCQDKPVFLQSIPSWSSFHLTKNSSVEYQKIHSLLLSHRSAILPWLEAHNIIEKDEFIETLYSLKETEACYRVDLRELGDNESDGGSQHSDSSDY